MPRLLSSGLGIVGAIGIQVAYNYYVTSQLIFSSYGNFGFIWDRPMFLSVLFSYQNSLVIYFPIFVVILIAGIICKTTRTLSFYFLGLVLFYALLSGFWYKWHMGPGFGNRLFVDLAPMLIIILAMACKELLFRTRTIVQIFCVLSALLSVQFMWGFWQRTLPEYRTGQIYWSHLLGQEQTPIYWHGILLLVCGVIFYRIVSLEKHNTNDKRKKGRELGNVI